MDISALKFLIAGCGSIGMRHLRNLISLGARRFILCDPDFEKLKRASKLPGKPPVLMPVFKEALKHAPDAAVICTPSSMHVKMCIEAAQRGIHLLIEKPLSDGLDGVDELSRVTQEKGIVAMMAMCYRFHPGLMRLKELLKDGSNTPLVVRVEGGAYLPDWRPGVDYRHLYAAKQRLGGGVVLDSIHSFDYIRWLFGDINKVAAWVGKVSDLKIETEDTALVLMETGAGVPVELRLDYIQRRWRHDIRVTCAPGEIVWDYYKKSITVDNAGTKTVEEIPFEVNDMYLSEMKAFIEMITPAGAGALAGGPQRHTASLHDGIQTLSLALAAKISSTENRWINIKEQYADHQKEFRAVDAAHRGDNTGLFPDLQQKPEAVPEAHSPGLRHVG